jgi:hypothetical protein
MGQVLSEGMRHKTRKDHVCCVCGLKIPAGAPALFQVNAGYDWGFCAMHWHVECKSNFDEEDW